jgi:hypothetical protein
MIASVLFSVYIIILLLYTIYTGLNYYRIQASGRVHPQVITFLLPFMVNVKMRNYLVFICENGLQRDQPSVQYSHAVHYDLCCWSANKKSQNIWSYRQHRMWQVYTRQYDEIKSRK